MHITEIPERTTFQFDMTVANLVADPDQGRLQLIFEIDARPCRPLRVNLGNGIRLQREPLPGEMQKSEWKEREADEVFRRIRKRLLGFLARWKLWQAPVTFERPATHADKGATVKVFGIIVQRRDKFVESYLKLVDAMRQHRLYADMSVADPDIEQS